MGGRSYLFSSIQCDESGGFFPLTYSYSLDSDTCAHHDAKCILANSRNLLAKLIANAANRRILNGLNVEISHFDNNFGNRQDRSQNFNLSDLIAKLVLNRWGPLCARFLLLKRGGRYTAGYANCFDAMHDRLGKAFGHAR